MTMLPLATGSQKKQAQKQVEGSQVRLEQLRKELTKYKEMEVSFTRRTKSKVFVYLFICLRNRRENSKMLLCFYKKKKRKKKKKKKKSRKALRKSLSMLLHLPNCMK